MYPSKEQPEFAPFMKNIEDGLSSCGLKVDKIIIEGRGKTSFSKLKKYILFYYQIFKCDLTRYNFIQVSYPSHSYLPLFFKSLKHSKLLIRLHGEDLIPSEQQESLMLKFGRMVFTRISILKADLVIVPSFYFLEVIKNKYNPKNVYVYPSGGVDIKKFYSKTVPKNIFTIGYVGRLAQGKGVDILLNALKSIAFDFKMIIVGAGQQESQLKELASKLGIINRVEFVGSVRNDLLIDYYNKFDIFCFPTLRKAESFGNVAIEAMACKIPVIGSEISGLKDYIKESYNGYFFEAGNILMLAEKLTKYHSLPETVKEVMKNNAYQTAMKYERSYLTNNFVDHIIKIFRNR